MADGEPPAPGNDDDEAACRCPARPPARYFCTAGRGMEPFLRREVQARLDATQVESVSGKVFFTTRAELNTLKKLKSAERLFLLLNKYPPLPISRNKGRVIHDIQTLVNTYPSGWLDRVSFWRSLHSDASACQECPDSPKRKLEEEERNLQNKRQKREQMSVSAERQTENEQGDETLANSKDSDFSGDKWFLEKTDECSQDKSVERNSFSFRVSCRCRGALAKSFTAQEVGKIIGIALMKSFGWKADLRNPDIEIVVHLNDIYSVIGIPVFRLSLASRGYIQTAGLRSTIAWAMASLAEIKSGAFVLDPTCGLGTVLLEAAMEWPNVRYLGTDISDSQLQGASSNIKAAGLMDKIELLKASITALPLPSESINVVFADVPFGKKFRITKDMELLPHVFQEIERVLCAGGIVVLLLSQELYKCLHNISRGPETENPISVERSSANSTQKAAASMESNTEENNGSARAISPAAQDARKDHICNKTAAFGSLLLTESFEVSLGKTDAIICKYEKVIMRKQDTCT